MYFYSTENTPTARIIVCIQYLYISVGTPVHTMHDPHPSQEMIDNYHRKYVDQLKLLFLTFKTNFGVPDDTELKLI